MAENEVDSTTCCCSFWPFKRKAHNSQLTEPLHTAIEDHGEGGGAASGAAGSSRADADVDGIDPSTRSQLKKILDEVLQTERTYVASLDALASHFLPVLKPHLGAAQSEASDLLTTAVSLLGVHRELLARIELADADMWAVARAFALMTPFLRMYSTYCGLYTRALERITALRKQVAALGELEASRQELIDSLLIRPVQRLCKYPLFFGEILKLLPHGGLKSEIETAAAAVRKINEEVNTKTRGFAEGARLIELHVELGGKLPALLAPTRTLLLELEVKVSSGRATARRRKFKLVLLSDALVLARVRKPPSAASAMRKALPTSFTRRRSDRSESATIGTAPLKLKAVLPLKSIELQSTASTSRRGKTRAASSKQEAILTLQCQEPAASYSCKCADASAAASLIQAVQSAREQLETATRKSERRASLVDPSSVAAAAAATAADETTESLIASARTSSQRRGSLRDRLSGRRRSSSSSSAVGGATADAGLAAGSLDLEFDSTRDDDDDLLGLVLSSDSENDSESESGSDFSTASEYEDD